MSSLGSTNTPPLDEKKNVVTKVESNASNAETFMEIDPVKERKLLHKYDYRTLPILAILYFLSFLDRGNIGNASVAGMTEQLNLSPNQYSLAVSIFYATYIISELPAVLIARKIGFRKYFAAMLSAWSLITIFTAFVRDHWSLVLCRLLLGFAEGGVFPNMSLYISIIYKREEQGRRLAYLYVCSCFGGAFGGLIGTGITHIKPTGVLQSWSFLYIIEGAISLAALCYIYFLPDDPINAPFLNEEEKLIMQQREEQRKEYMGSDKFDKSELKLAFQDPKVIMSCIIQFCVDLVLYGFSTFLPTILRTQLGFDAMKAQYLTIPVYAVAAIGNYVILLASDRMGQRSPFTIGTCCLSLAGYVILLASKNSAVNYFATYLIAITLYTTVALNLTWLNNNMAPHYRRATALGINQTIGNLAGVIAGQVYRDPPHYYLGNGFSLGCVVVAISLTGTMNFYLRRKQAVKDSIIAGAEDKRRVQTGSEAANFQYVY